MKLTLLTFVFLFHLIIGYTQTITNQVNEYIANQQNGQVSTEIIKKLEKYSLSDVLTACSSKLSDSLVSTRGFAYQLIYSVALRKPEDPHLPKVINALITGLDDTDGGVVYNNYNYLTQFSATAFDIEAKIKLSQLVKHGTQHYPLLIKLTGFAGISDLTYDYKEMLRLKTYKDKNTRWAVYLALARLGSTEHAGFCLNMVQKYPVSDDVVYELLPDLAYIRTKEAFDYMLNIILKDDKNCSSSNPDSEAKIICAYRVIKIVAPYIVNFPVKIDKGGDIITKNYEITLLEVREWINTNINSYDLITQKY
jgi:hypothetical protein